ncbi:PilZ domain-containing protein [Erythrobacter sp. HL-111]|uniref:PilZ domain-containing protein n=1 Tax=Erythrobacter sp. HL-111 TaxID=1798193 RepID=UPI0006D9747D|nr:PilZ domain-containing protein [Erythrobacter sp. HL-111]KPP89365.1 MAG: PilZ domain [Erythrobacteraceae bacterium HL-111]SDR87585.1 PilZ domain-containing protein [Erythrobacter sp. HL-111]
MNLHSITRTSERRPLSLVVRGRVRSRPVFVDLIDISEGGCKIRGTQGFASIGDRVVMKVGGVNAPLGTIAWVEGRIAGVAFEGQMHSAVLDYLCQAQGASAAPVERDALRHL